MLSKLARSASVLAMRRLPALPAGDFDKTSFNVARDWGRLAGHHSFGRPRRAGWKNSLYGRLAFGPSICRLRTRAPSVALARFLFTLRSNGLGKLNPRTSSQGSCPRRRGPQLHSPPPRSPRSGAPPFRGGALGCFPGPVSALLGRELL